MNNLSSSQDKLLKSDIEDLIADSANTKPTKPDHDFRIILIKARAIQSLNGSIEKLRQSVNSNSESSQNLSKRVIKELLENIKLVDVQLQLKDFFKGKHLISLININVEKNYSINLPNSEFWENLLQPTLHLK